MGNRKAYGYDAIPPLISPLEFYGQLGAGQAIGRNVIGQILPSSLPARAVIGWPEQSVLNSCCSVSQPARAGESQPDRNSWLASLPEQS